MKHSRRGRYISMCVCVGDEEMEGLGTANDGEVWKCIVKIMAGFIEQ